MARKAVKKQPKSLANRWEKPYFIRDKNDYSLWHIQVTITEKQAICGTEEKDSSDLVPVIDLKEYIKARSTCKKCVKGFRKLLREKKGE